MIQITVPSCPIVKKNTAKMSFMYKDKKSGRLIQRPAPVHYYLEPYKKWAKNAIKACAEFINQHPEMDFPLTGQYNLKCIFYMNVNRVVDLSALYEGPQDVLAGNAGVWKESVPSRLYQIIEDDSTRFIGSHDGSRVVLDYVNPRTEITLTEFKL